MWLKFSVVGLHVTPKAKAARVYLKASLNDSSFQVNDASLSAFCLPLGPDSQKPCERMAPEEYTFTLTQGDGSRVQGFCRRFLPPAPRIGAKQRYPQVMCIVCEASWSSLFFKVLEIVEQLLRPTDLLSDLDVAQLPPSCPAGRFLTSLGDMLASEPAMGTVLRVPIPAVGTPLSVSPPKRIGADGAGPPLQCTDEYVDLQIPPDCGNGRLNAGTPLARLLWHVPVPAMLTLIASLLLERRVIVVGHSRDMVSAAVAAAAALLHPFKWHHIYLPLLPVSFRDYLTAPMPFLIGLPAQLLPALKGIPMDEVTMIDLDLGKCEPAPGSPHDDAHALPWRDMLESALHAAYGLLRSPTEHESNPLIISIMQGYFLKLLGNYRSYIHDEAALAAVATAAAAANGSSPISAGATGGSVTGSPGRGDKGSSGSSSRGGRDAGRDDMLRGYGMVFDHAALVASHRRNERARAFLQAFRHSQMYEQFIQERLQAAAQGRLGDDPDDTFETRVTAYMEQRRGRLAARLSSGAKVAVSKFQAFVAKHRRTTSSCDSSSGTEDAAGRAARLARAFADAAAGQVAKRTSSIRRTLTESQLGVQNGSSSAGERGRSAPAANLSSSADWSASSSRGSCPTNGASNFPGASVTTLDPAAFFEEEDDVEDDVAEAAEAAARAAAAESSGRFSRVSSSGSMREAAHSRSASFSVGATAGYGANDSLAGGSNRQRPSPASSPSLVQQQQQQQQQRSGAVASPLPPSPRQQLQPALIDLASDDGRSSNGSVHSSPERLPPPARLPQPRYSQQHEQLPSSSLLGHAAAATASGRSSSTSSSQPASVLRRMSVSSSSDRTSLSAGGAGTAQQAAARLSVKTALAAMPAGPLPQPPAPRNSLLASVNPQLQQQQSSLQQQCHQQHAQQHSQQPNGVTPKLLGDKGSSTLTGSPLADRHGLIPAGSPGDTSMITTPPTAEEWDPFAELAASRAGPLQENGGSSGGASSSGGGGQRAFDDGFSSLAAAAVSKSSSSAAGGAANQNSSNPGAAAAVVDAVHRKSIGGLDAATKRTSSDAIRAWAADPFAAGSDDDDPGALQSVLHSMQRTDLL